jgi:hypothetical protein
MAHPLLELEAHGQSIWLDDIDRGQLRSGQFGRLVDKDGLSALHALRRSDNTGHECNVHCGPVQARRIRSTAMCCMSRN